MVLEKNIMRRVRLGRLKRGLIEISGVGEVRIRHRDEIAGSVVKGRDRREEWDNGIRREEGV